MADPAHLEIAEKGAQAIALWRPAAALGRTWTSSGSAERVELTEPGLTGDSNRQAFKGYELSFTVTPYPEAGKPIPRGDYRLILTVRKGTSSPS